MPWLARSETVTMPTRTGCGLLMAGASGWLRFPRLAYGARAGAASRPGALIFRPDYCLPPRRPADTIGGPTPPRNPPMLKRLVCLVLALALAAGAALAEEVKGKLIRVDAGKGVVVLSAAGKERTFAVGDAAKVVDAR